MIWQGLSLLPLAVILGVYCVVLRLMTTTYRSSMDDPMPKPNKVPCFFAAMLLVAAACLAIAAAFDETFYS